MMNRRQIQRDRSVWAGSVAWLGACLGVGLAVLAAAPSGAEPQASEAGFVDTFDGRDAPGEGWRVSEKMAGSWSVKDGVLVADQLTPDHGAVIDRPLAFRDLDLSFDFMFDGGDRFNLVIDDDNEKSVHAGHICRISISPKRLTVGDDKTGKMNKKIRELRQKGDQVPARERERMKKHLASREVSAAVNLEQGRWYRLRATIVGNVFQAYLDGKPVAELRSPGIAHRTKTDFGFTVTGSVVRFDNIEAEISGQ